MDTKQQYINRSIKDLSSCYKLLLDYLKIEDAVMGKTHEESCKIHNLLSKISEIRKTLEDIN